MATTKSYADLYEEQGLDFVSRSGDNWSSKCPFHEDSTASFSVEVVKGLFKCFSPACWAFEGGDFKKFYEKKTGKLYADTLVVPWEEVEEYHQRLLSDQKQMGWLAEKRGLTVQTVSRFKLGHDGERFTIPIMAEGRVTNLRRYSSRKGVSVKVVLSDQSTPNLSVSSRFISTSCTVSWMVDGGGGGSGVGAGGSATRLVTCLAS